MISPAGGDERGSGADRLLVDMGLPVGDRHDRPDSPSAFEDGGQYRVEIPSVEGFEAAAAVVAEADRLDVPLHRMSSGSGIMLMGDAELADLAQLGAARGIEVCPFVGPRAPWEGSASALTPDGGQVGWRHTTMDQLRFALRDVERAVAAGLRSVLLADEGLISVVDHGRRQGYFPDDLVLKGSAVLGVGNAAGLRVLAGLGLDTMNVPSDLPVAALSSARQASALVIDLYIESPDGLGGFLRYHEIDEIVRVAAPVHVKFGLRNSPGIYPSGRHMRALVTETSLERVRRARIGMDHLQRLAPGARSSPVGARRRGVPVV